MTRWLFVLGLSGCSLALQGPDPNRPREQKCDTSKGAVALDGLGATALGVGGLAAASANSSGAAVALLAGSALLAGIAIHGSHVVDACRASEAIDIAHAVPLPPMQSEAAVPPPRIAAKPEQPPEYADPPPRPVAPAPTDDPWRDFWKVSP